MILNDIDNAYVGNEEADKIYLGDTQIYPTGPAPVDYRSMPLTIEALSGGTLQLTNTTSQTDIYYNLNDDGWQLINTNNMSFNVDAGDIIQFGATEAVDLQQYSAGRSLFSGNTLAFKVYGNIESLEYGYGDFTNRDTAVYLASAFTSCFRDCSGLTDASNLVLPATSLAQRCYQLMFRGCTNLTSTPELPATTLTSYCYNSMFRDCTSLTTAPELPVTTLAQSCYSNMFNGCASLTTAPELPATTLKGSCYNSMFAGCTSITTAPELPATALTSNCYYGMFSGCTSLTQAPELPATTAVSYCYDSMFAGCTSITTAPELPVTTLAQSCYSNMFNGCASLTTAPELPATTLAENCYYNMFQGCTGLTQAPELPATTLANYCYNGMFSGCTSLNYIKCLATNISATRCTYNWVAGVGASGTFVKAPSMTGWTTGASGIPTNWAVVDNVSQ